MLHSLRQPRDELRQPRADILVGIIQVLFRHAEARIERRGAGEGRECCDGQVVLALQPLDHESGRVPEYPGREPGAEDVGEGLVAALRERGVPVVITTRCQTGPALPVYGGPGGGRDLAAMGCIFGRGLNGVRSRLLLAAGLGAGMGENELAALFAGPRGTAAA